MMRIYPLLLLLTLSLYQLQGQQLVIPIADPSDDLEELIADGSLDEGSSDLELGSEDADGSTPQIVGLRFVDIEIPEGAIITSAYLQFYVDEAKGNETTSDLVIYAENALDAAPFDASTPGNLSSRERVEMEIGWSVPSGNWMTVGLGGEDQQTPDISPLINLLIDAGWQSGSAMVFMIEGTGTKAALSADNDFGLVTELVINYGTASDFNYQIADGLDDHEERISTGSMDANSSDLELGSEDGDGSTPQLVGLRFTDVNIPAGATIVDASIQFTVDESKSTEAANYTIQLENSPNPEAYSNDDGSVSSRMYLEGGVNWDIAANTWTMAGESGDDQKTPNLSTLVQAAIDQEGWEAGNAIAFAISGSGTRVAESFEGDPVSAAVLNIIAVTPDDGSTALQVCDTLPPTGNEEVQLFHLGTYATGLFDESAAEIVAFDDVTGNLVFVNANANTVSILDISDPKAPAIVNEINMDAYGGGVNSIDVFNGVIAAASEGENVSDNGSVVFLDTAGNEISVVEVGVLPDMITYSPDGSYVMTANEGQPSDDYTEDPEGSASIIMSNGGDFSAPTVTNVTFEAFNDQVVSLRNAGVRIFGPGASVAQDLEPEYIAISSDGATAYVSCQENNAFVVIDVETATAVDIYPLGTKDHSVGQPKLTEFVLNEILGDNWPSLGTPLFDNPAVQLGGFSGMHFAEGESSETEYVFYVVPDRGPNDGAVNRNTSIPAAPANLRPFKLPDYQGRIIRFTVDIADGSVELDDPILLQQADGTPISGKGNIPGFDEVPVTVADGKFAFEPFTTEENLGSFSEFSVMSDASWETNLVDGNFVAEANGFGADTFSNDWLISPAYDLSGLTSASLSFKSYIRFDGGALDVLISTDYDGMGNPEEFTWDTITDQVTLADTDSLIESGNFDLANYLTSSTYVAFQYTSTGTGPGDGARWRIDDIAINADPAEYGDFQGPDSTWYTQLEYDPFGGDFEGIQIANDGTFWMCDEYRPAIYHFDAMGTLIERYVAEGTAQLGTEPQEAGFYGAETLPAPYALRRANRGFEALAYDSDSDIVYAFIQSPLYNPDNSTRNASDVIRILGVQASDGMPVSEYVYLLERNARSGVSAGRVDKIGDADYIGDGKFIVLERDSGTPDDEDGFESKKYVFEIDLTGATNILDLDLAAVTDTNTLEQMSADMLAAAGIQAVAKRKVLNLPSIGYLPSDKPEGLAMLPNGDIAVMNDNDFGLAGAGVSDKSSLGIIQMCADNSLDASNRSEGINIQNWPVQGFYMPDAIAAFESNGKTYIATANEGDSRDYDGYSEEVRVEDLTLDPEKFPNAAELQMEQNLGRLKTTEANGDLDGDGDFDVIYSYGARSFSIFDEFGNLVYDSGNDFEQILAEIDPDNFNSNNDENDSQKSRSDDKGPEPEAIEIVNLDGETYALVGLERQGGIMVYNITNIDSVYYVSYTNNRNFDVAADSSIVGDLGVEDIIFIDAANSPIDAPLVVTANEVSGTISLFAVNDEFASSEFVLQILHNNDGESKFLPTDVGGRLIGGAAEFTTAIQELQGDEFPNITLSSGDNVLPGINFNASLALPEERQIYDVVVLEEIGYDALCIGNHDFDFGPDILADIINDFETIQPPYLSANLNFMAEPNLQALVDAGRIASSTVVEVDGEQIGVIGLSPPNLRTISTPGLVEVLPNTVEIAQDEIDGLLAQGINKIILISHLQGIDSEIELAPQLTGVDVIIAGGGDELLTNDPAIALPGIEIRGEYPLVESDANGEPVYIVTTAGEYRYLGNLLVGFDEAGNVLRIGDESNPILIEGFAADSALQVDVIDSIIAYNQGLADNIIATTEVDLDGLRESVRTKETNLGNMAADAFLSLANANAEGLGFTDAPIVAVQNGGGMRNNSVIAAGSEISEQTTFDVLPFDNNVAVLGPITPIDFKAMLEHAVSDVEGVDGRFLQVAGFEFVYNPAGTPGENRVFSAMLDDSTMMVDEFTVVDSAPSIYITLVDFLANGGDDYAVFEGKPFTRIGASYQRAFFDYIVNDLNGLITAAQYPAGGEGRITTFVPEEDTTIVDIVSSSPDHEFLTQILALTDAGTLLSGDGPFTLFAPNDVAFGELSEELVNQATADPALLASILGYHVIPGTVLSSDLMDGMSATTTNGEEITVSIVGDSIFINETAYVYSADNMADNGVVHFIDEVLLPPSIVSTADLDLSAFDFLALPSPFSDQLNISFTLESSADVRLDMFNLLGQHVLNISDKTQLNGQQSFSLDTRNLPNGIYTIQMQVDDRTGHMKIIKQ